MKRLGNLWPEVVRFENLWCAWKKARRGKARRASVAAFELNLEANLLALQQELLEGAYQPGAYRLFTIYERKPRQIAAAPFRDRVVHHALMNMIEPPLDRRFIDDCYACRKSKGIHSAVNRYQTWAQRYPYVLKIDIRRYFPSIDHAILKAKLCHRIKDQRVLSLLDSIIDSSPPFPDEPLQYFLGDDLLTPLERRCGIAIGNLTSQFFANLYLDDFDHWVKEILKCPAYLRYVDDGVLLADDKQQLTDWLAAIQERLEAERLQVHPNKASISPTVAGLTLLGYRVFPRYRRLRPDNGYRFRRRLRKMAQAYQHGRLDWDDIDPRVQSWLGHACHAETKRLRTAIFAVVSFHRGVDR